METATSRSTICPSTNWLTLFTGRTLAVRPLRFALADEVCWAARVVNNEMSRGGKKKKIGTYPFNLIESPAPASRKIGQKRHDNP